MSNKDFNMRAYIDIINEASAIDMMNDPDGFLQRQMRKKSTSGKTEQFGQDETGRIVKVDSKPIVAGPYDDIGMEDPDSIYGPEEDFEALAGYGAEEDFEALAGYGAEEDFEALAGHVEGPEEDFEALAGHVEGPEEDFEALAGHGKFSNNQNGYHKREGQNFWTIDNDDPYWDTHDMEGSSAFEEAPRTDKEETPKFDMNFWTSLFK